VMMLIEKYRHMEIEKGSHLSGNYDDCPLCSAANQVRNSHFGRCRHCVFAELPFEGYGNDYYCLRSRSLGQHATRTPANIERRMKFWEGFLKLIKPGDATWSLQRKMAAYEKRFNRENNIPKPKY